MGRKNVARCGYTRPAFVPEKKSQTTGHIRQDAGGVCGL